MNLTNARYAFISAYLKGEETRGVTSEHIDELLRKSETIQDALETISGSDIGRYLLDQPIKTFDDADTYLWLYMGECLKRFEGFNIPVEMSRIVNLYVEKYDVMNIRIKLRMISKEAASSMVPLGMIHSRGHLEEISFVREMDELFEILAKCNLGDYIRVIEDLVRRGIWQAAFPDSQGASL